MTYLVLVIHLLSCIILILAILLQSGKSADLAGAFGGTGSQTTFGPRSGATVLSRITTGAAVMFMLTSLGLCILMSRTTGGSSSLLNKFKGKATATSAAPGSQTPAKSGASTTVPVTVPVPQPEAPNNK